MVWKETPGYHLVDAGNQGVLQIFLNSPGPVIFDEIKFGLGIDSLTNVSGAMGGALDPAQGMYWTWQSGYINVKVEGKSSRCTSRNNEFIFHLGGYQHPFNAFQYVVLNTRETTNIYIPVDLKYFIESTDLSLLNHIMSPGIEAMDMSEKFSASFKPHPR